MRILALTQSVKEPIIKTAIKDKSMEEKSTFGMSFTENLGC